MAINKAPDEAILPDLAEKGLKVIFCGMAAGKYSAKMEHHYAHPQNRFWSILNEAGFTNKVIDPDKDKREENFRLLLKQKIGLTDLIIDQSGNDDELHLDRTALRQSRYRLLLFIIKFQPDILAFVGKKPAELYLGHKVKYGMQPPTNDIGDTRLFVLPSTSPAASRWWAEHKSYWRELRDLKKKR
ncbi:MAG: mismatch-specific DNA-glycosylase [Bacillota bacterium]